MCLGWRQALECAADGGWEAGDDSPPGDAAARLHHPPGDAAARLLDRWTRCLDAEMPPPAPPWLPGLASASNGRGWGLSLMVGVGGCLSW